MKTKSYVNEGECGKKDQNKKEGILFVDYSFSPMPIS